MNPQVRRIQLNTQTKETETEDVKIHLKSLGC